jgi:PIN domain nuclease of toxin-antitoxin system
VTRLLLDTNVVLRWLAMEPLAKPVTTLIADGSTEAHVSIASAWEVAIKTSIGKLRPPEDFADVARESGFALLTIDVEHTRAVRDLPLHHGTPSTGCSWPRPSWKGSRSSRATIGSLTTASG